MISRIQNKYKSQNMRKDIQFRNGKLMFTLCEPVIHNKLTGLFFTTLGYLVYLFYYAVTSRF